MKFATFLILLILFTASYSNAQVAVIANKSVPLENVNSSKLFDLYSGDIKWWDNGDAVVVFDLKIKSETKARFYSFLGKTTSRMKSIWMKKMLSGEGDPPEALVSEEEMLKKVASTKGAIGFISLDKINNTIKTISVINQ